MSVDQGPVEPQAGTPAPRGEPPGRRFLAWNLRPLAAGFEEKVQLLPSIVSNRQPPVAPAPARVRVGADETVATGIGELHCARVEVARGDGSELLLWIGRDGVRALARYETREKGAATRSGTLRALERTIYWKD